jgi:hypothetical protein
MIRAVKWTVKVTEICDVSENTNPVQSISANHFACLRCPPARALAAPTPMRNRWVQITALFVASASCSTITMHVSRDELQADIEKRFPRVFEEQVVSLTLSEPEIDMSGAPGILGVKLRFAAASASERSRLDGVTRVEGRLEYVAQDHAFYLRDPVITDLALETPQGPGHLAHAMGRLRAVAGDRVIEHGVRDAIRKALVGHPIYRLDARRSEREAKAIRHLRRARVEGGELVLEVGL